MSGLFGGKASNASQTQQAAGIRVQTSVYGTPIKIVYGTNRITGNLIWYGNFQAHSSSQSAGGKGGGGGGKGSSSYTYSAAVAIALCEGEIYGIGLTWSGQNQYQWGPPGYGAQLGFSFFGGNYPQAPWGYLTANFPGQDLGYEGIAYVANPNLDLGSNASLPNYSFEVIGLLTNGEGDVNPAAIIPDFLCDPNHGSGWKTSWIDSAHLAQYSLYCQAIGFLFSPVYDSQTQGQQAIQDLLDSSNSTCWWSEGVLKIYPYADQAVTGNGVTFTPNTTPVYDLNDDDFIFTDGQDPVQITRKSPADAYNIVDLQYVDRTSAYASAIAEAKDLYSISQYGPRYDTVRQYDHITTAAAAQTCAQLILQRDLYIRNSYQFILGWAFCGLELMDIVTLTDSRMGLSKLPVRIIAIEEDAQGQLTFMAEDFPIGFATAPQYSVQAPSGYQGNWNAPAPTPNAVVFYEPPGQLTNNQPVLWLGVGGTGDWGGCQVWVSLDGITYTNQGTINGTARVGVTTTALGITGDPDLVDVLGVDLTASAGVLNSGTQADADNYSTLCVIGEELISYETAALTAASKYNLSYLRRGAYGTAEEVSPVGTPFMRVDQSVFSYPFDSSLIGNPIYIKLVSFNQFGGGYQDLSTVPVYTYNVQGSAVNQALANVTGVYTAYVAGITKLFWSPIVDYRAFDYEIRYGISWGSATFLGRTTSCNFPTSGDGTYWVAAHYRNPNGYDVYSDSPFDVSITGSILVLNNIASYHEAATGWSGTVTGSAGISGGQLSLTGAGNILTATNALTIPNVLQYGGIGAAGTYALPSSHAVNVQRVASCSVRMSVTGFALSVTDNILTIPNILSATDLLDNANGQYVTITPQIAIAQANGVYGPWQNYQPGSYTGQYFKGQVVIATSNPNVTPLVTDISFAVDIDTRTDTFTNQAIATAGTTLTYPNGTFNAGPNGASTPNVQVTVLNAQPADTVVISGKTLSQVTIQVTSGGTGVARTVDVAVTGY